MGVVRRALADDDDDDEGNEKVTPAASKPASVYNDDDALDNEDEDEHTGRSTAIQSGRSGASRIKQLGSEFANEFRFEKGTKHLVKFLEEESFASYRQHWIERKGKKSFICIGKGCPLCTVGDRASGKFAYNVYDYGNRSVKALIVGPVLLEQIEEEASATATGVLTDYYWALGRSGKGNKTSYSMSVVKERDLEEDHGITPAEATAALDDLTLYKPSIFLVPTLAQLQKIAREAAEDDSDDDDD